jgi:hypothetical protein
MRETYELRVNGKFASRLFGKNEGKRLADGLVRLVRIAPSDPRVPEIVRLQRKLDREKGEPFFFSARVLRDYSPDELATAPLFCLNVSATFEPAGEECGTTYDDTAACSICGADAPQTSDLRLELAKIPRTRTLARTIANEVVIAGSMATQLRQVGAPKSCFQPVRTCSSDAKSKDWCQLLVPEPTVEVAPNTRFGDELFATAAESREHECPLGHVKGLTRLSEVYVQRESYHGEHLAASVQFVGVRRGLLRPERLLFCSPKLAAILGKVPRGGGFGIEPVHFV